MTLLCVRNFMYVRVAQVGPCELLLTRLCLWSALDGSQCSALVGVPRHKVVCVCAVYFSRLEARCPRDSDNRLKCFECRTLQRLSVCVFCM